MKRRILFAILLLLALGALAIYVLHGHQPHYRGQPLRHWLEAYSPMSGSTNTWAEADAAVSAAGNDAIPTLLTMLRANDSKTKLKMVELVQRQHIIPFHHIPAEQLHFDAAMAFRRLGTNSAPAIPGLVRIYAKHISDSSRTACVMALDDIAAGNVPLLASQLVSRDAGVRDMLVGVLSRVSAPPAEVVPVLSKCLADPSSEVRATAASSLARIGTNAASAVPALRRACQDTNSQVRSVADYALQRVAPETARHDGAN